MTTLEKSLQPKPLVIYGNGAMAATYASYLQRNFTIAAFTVEAIFCQSKNFCDLPLVPFETVADNYTPENHCMIIAVGYRDMNHLRAEISRKAWALGYEPATYVAEDLWLHKGVEIGRNSVVFDKCSLHVNAKIGDNSFIASGVHIGHDCRIGNNVWINSGVALAGGVVLGDSCFLGVNASVAHGVTLGEGTFVGANTLVTKNTEPYQVVVSAPGEAFELDSRTYLLMLEGR